MDGGVAHAGQRGCEVVFGAVGHVVSLGETELVIDGHLGSGDHRADTG